MSAHHADCPIWDGRVCDCGGRADAAGVDRVRNLERAFGELLALLNGLPLDTTGALHEKVEAIAGRIGVDVAKMRRQKPG